MFDEKKKRSRGGRKEVKIRIPKIFLLSFIITSLLSVYFLLSDRGLITYIAQKREIAKLERKIQTLKEEKRQLEERISLIKKRDPEYLVYLFRKFGWVRKGEKIVKPPD